MSEKNHSVYPDNPPPNAISSVVDVVEIYESDPKGSATEKTNQAKNLHVPVFLISKLDNYRSAEKKLFYAEILYYTFSMTQIPNHNVSGILKIGRSDLTKSHRREIKIRFYADGVLSDLVKTVDKKIAKAVSDLIKQMWGYSLNGAIFESMSREKTGTSEDSRSIMRLKHKATFEVVPSTIQQSMAPSVSKKAEKETSRQIRTDQFENLKSMKRVYVYLNKNKTNEKFLNSSLIHFYCSNPRLVPVKFNVEEAQEFSTQSVDPIGEIPVLSLTGGVGSARYIRLLLKKTNYSS